MPASWPLPWSRASVLASASCLRQAGEGDAGGAAAADHAAPAAVDVEARDRTAVRDIDDAVLLVERDSDHVSQAGGDGFNVAAALRGLTRGQREAHAKYRVL